MSDSEIVAVVTVSGSDLDTETLVELVESNIVVAIEENDDEGDTNFIITSIAASSAIETDTDDSDKNNSNVTDYTVFITILVVFVTVCLLTIAWFVIDNCMKKRHQSTMNTRSLAEMNPVDSINTSTQPQATSDRAIGLETDVVANEYVGQQPALPAESNNISMMNQGLLNSNDHDAMNMALPAQPQVGVTKGGGVGSGSDAVAMELIDVELPQQPKIIDTSDGIGAGGEGDVNSDGVNGEVNAEPPIPAE